MHKKYSSYDEAMDAFNSTINSVSTSKPSSSVTEPASTPSDISYKYVVIFFLCSGVCDVDQAEEVQWLQHLVSNCNL
jgi:hypothetical protein